MFEQLNWYKLTRDTTKYSIFGGWFLLGGQIFWIAWFTYFGREGGSNREDQYAMSLGNFLEAKTANDRGEKFSYKHDADLSFYSLKKFAIIIRFIGFLALYLHLLCDRLTQIGGTEDPNIAYGPIRVLIRILVNIPSSIILHLVESFTRFSFKVIRPLDILFWHSSTECPTDKDPGAKKQVASTLLDISLAIIAITLSGLGTVLILSSALSPLFGAPIVLNFMPVLANAVTAFFNAHLPFIVPALIMQIIVPAVCTLWTWTTFVAMAYEGPDFIKSFVYDVFLGKEYRTRAWEKINEQHLSALTRGKLDGQNEKLIDYLDNSNSLGSIIHRTHWNNGHSSFALQNKHSFGFNFLRLIGLDELNNPKWTHQFYVKHRTEIEDGKFVRQRLQIKRRASVSDIHSPRSEADTKPKLSTKASSLPALRLSGNNSGDSTDEDLMKESPRNKRKTPRADNVPSPLSTPRESDAPTTPSTAPSTPREGDSDSSVYNTDSGSSSEEETSEESSLTL